MLFRFARAACFSLVVRLVEPALRRRPLDRQEDRDFERLLWRAVLRR